MATLLAVATGNLTAATTFALVDATSLLLPLAGGTLLSTAYSVSSTFTPGAITTDGFAMKLRSRVNGSASTLTVALDQAGSDVAGSVVTINVSDLPSDVNSTDANGGWIFFKFASTVTLAAATAYSVKAKVSINSAAEFYNNNVSNNFARMLRTTTTQAPAAGDVMHVVGEFTGAGAITTLTVTMDSTATTDYGAGTDGLEAFTTNKGGVLTYGTTAATNYYLKLSGDCIVYSGGVFNKGTSGTPIPRDSTAVLEFDPVADGGMGLIVRNGGTFTDQGLSRTSGKNVTWCRINTDEAIAQTTLGVDTDTGWLSGDSIVVGKSYRTSSSITETKVLNANAGASSMDITVGLSTARSGTTPIQAPIGLLTRNSKIRAASNTVMSYCNFKSTSTVDIDWCEFTNLGDNATGKRGIEVETTTGSFSMQYCSEYSVEDNGFVTVGSTTDNIVVDDCVFYALNNVATNGLYPFQIAATSGTSCHYRRNLFANLRVAGGSQAAINLLDVGNDFSNNFINDTVSGSNIFMNEGSTIGTFDNNEVGAAGSGAGLTFQSNGCRGTINGLKLWSNNGEGLLMNATVLDMTINDYEGYGNLNRNLLVGNSANVNFNRPKMGGLSTAATVTNVVVNGGSSSSKFVFTDAQLSQASGQIVAASFNDIAPNGSNMYTDMLFKNSLFGAATLVSSPSSFSGSSVIAFEKYQQTTNRHLWYTKYGIASATGAGLTDTTVRTPGSLNVRIAPTDSTTGFSWSFFIPATSNTTVSFQGFFQKNAAFGTDVATVSLFLPGSTVSDATTTLSNTTGSYLSAAVSAYYSGVDGLATVTINAKTTTANAYLYAADFYNSGDTVTLFDKLAGLTIWNNGLPSPLITQINLGGVPSAVWAVATSGLTAAGTTGKKLVDLHNASLLIDGELII